MRANVTISKRRTTKGEGCFAISISDESSGLPIVSVEMDLAEFAECIGGLAYCKAEINKLPTSYSVDRYGKEKQVKTVQMPKGSINWSSSKDHIKAEVNAHFLANYSGDDWELWSDGIGTQQRSQEFHDYVICRYGDKDEAS